MRSFLRSARAHNLPSSSSLRAIEAAARPQRSYAFQAPGSPTFEVFNRRIKWMQKERAASDVETSRQADYLKDEVATRLCERLLVGHPLSTLFDQLYFQRNHQIPHSTKTTLETNSNFLMYRT